jgi:hypothetical protein
MRFGITIQQRACPWCHNRLTGRIGDGPSVCFNCGHLWHGHGPFADARPVLEPAPLPAVAFLFESAATERLEVYRMAVRAGFYTDALLDVVAMDQVGREGR